MPDNVHWQGVSSLNGSLMNVCKGREKTWIISIMLSSNAEPKLFVSALASAPTFKKFRLR